MRWLLIFVFWAAPASAAKPYDSQVDGYMAQLGSPDWYARCKALNGLEKVMKSEGDEDLARRLLTLAEDVGHHDPSNETRGCAGDLSRSISDWRVFDGPEARARRAHQDRMQNLWETLWGYGIPLGFMAVWLIGGLWVVASRTAASYLVVHGDRLLEDGVRSSVRLFLKHPALLILPAFNALVFFLLMGFSFWRAAHDPGIFKLGTGAEIHFRVLKVVYQPLSLLAVVAAFCLAMLANSAYLAADVRAGRGEDAGLLTGLLDALGAAWNIALLSAATCAALIGVDWMARKIGAFATRSEAIALSFGEAVVESAAMLMLNISACAMIFERKDPAAAVQRSVEIVRPEWRSGLRAVAATALLRKDVVVTPLFCCGMCTQPLWMLFAIHDSATNWLLSGGLEFIAVACVGLGGVFAAFILALVWLLDASFAAAFYLHHAGARPLPLSVARAITEPVGS